VARTDPAATLRCVNVSMLLLASGRGTRFGGDIPKVFVECAGRPVVLRSVARLARVTERREIVLAVHPGDRARFVDPLRQQLDELGVTRIVDGGATRQESMTRALAASNPSFPLVLVHDAARPFLPVAATRSAMALAAHIGAALVAMPAPDTLKRVGDDHRVVETIDRAGIWLAQTPQVLRRDILVAALTRAQGDGFVATDDVSLVERLDAPVAVVPGSARNLKITTADDLELASWIARLEDRA
jgi:2-C-methyl-D-erythritol 4-phosphate cytidylyltransferase